MNFNPGFPCRRSFAAILLIILVGGIVYANTFNVPFILDDEKVIENNGIIRSIDYFYANSYGYDYMPNRYIACLTFALNFHFGGLEVAGYHAVNLFVHLLTALLVYALLRLTFRTPFFQVAGLGAAVSAPVAGGHSPSSPTRFSPFLAPGFFIPLFAALLFVVHPVQTQAVTYIVQRMTSLATMFYLLSLVLYVLARLRIERSPISRICSEGKPGWESTACAAGPADSPDTLLAPFFRSSRVIYPALFLLAGSVVASVLAMKTKEIAFTLPFAALLYEACFFRGAWKRRFLFLLPLMATLPIIPMTMIDFSGSGSEILTSSSEQLRVGDSISRLEYLFTQFRVIVTYLRLLILPVNQNLDYDYPVYASFFTPPVFLSFLLLVVIFALAVYLFRITADQRDRERKNSEGKASEWKSDHAIKLTANAVGVLRPDYSIIKCLRLVSFGILWFFLAFSVESSLIPLLDVIFEHRLYLPGFGAAAVFATVFYLLIIRVVRSSNSGLVLIYAGVLVLILGIATYQRNYVWGNSVRLWQDVVVKSPNKSRPYNNLGVVLERAGRRPEAFRSFNRAIAIDPYNHDAYYNLADLYLVSGQPEKALGLLQTAINLKPDFANAYVLAGAALMRAGRFQDVISFLEQNLDHIKEDAEGRFYLGAAHAFLGDRQAAMRELEVISRLDQAHAATLAVMLGFKGNHGLPKSFP
jgi:protein O-mannosyl-transferase